MKKLVAFAAAFLLALAVALVPLAVSDLGRPGAQHPAEAEHAGPLPPDVEARSLALRRAAQYGPPSMRKRPPEARREAATTMIVTALSIARARR